MLNEPPEQKLPLQQPLQRIMRKKVVPVYKPQLDQRSQADFQLFKRYESLQEPTIFELAELFDKLNRHFLPKVHDPAKARQLLESNHPIPRCYLRLAETFSNLELAMFHMLELGNRLCYTAIRVRVYEQNKL